MSAEKWHWKRNRTMQSLYAGSQPLGVYVPMANNKSYPLEIRQNIEAVATQILDQHNAFGELLAENQALRELILALSLPIAHTPISYEKALGSWMKKMEAVMNPEPKARP